MCRLNVSHLPSGLWQAGWGDAGERGTGPGAALLGSCLVGGLAERTAGILLLLATSRMLCSVTVSWLCCRLCLTFAEEEKPGMLRSGPTPTAFRRAGWPGGNKAGGGAPTAAADRLCYWTAYYIRALACICIYVVLECVPTQRVPSTWPAGRGMQGKHELQSAA